MLKILATLALLASPTLTAPSAIAQSGTEGPVVTRDGAENAGDYSCNYGWLGLLGLLGLAGLGGRKRRTDTSVHFDQG
jgi:MYXO-CTERM domain-containing protein